MERTGIDILWVASFGGHLIQLEKLIEIVNSKSSRIVTTSDYYENADYVVPQLSRSNMLTSLRSVLESARIIKLCRPKLIITTGSAPGLIFIILAKIVGIKTIWIDSVANSRQLSLSAKIASRITKVYTQWELVSQKERVECIGNILKCS